MRRQSVIRWLPPSLTALTLALPLACAEAPPPTASPADAVRAPLVVPFEINDEMRRWARLKTLDGGDDLERMQQLMFALQEDSEGLRLRYREGYTGTAQEAFATGEVNCLSFSHLLVGLAREVGVDAYYLDVAYRQEFERQGQLMVIMGHVTVGFDYGVEQQIVEFRIGPEIDYRRSRRISDRRAQAHHYTNRGAEELREGRPAEAVALLETAVEIDPDLPDAWLNLGVARRRSADLAGAEAAYKRAIDANPEYLPAYQNLSGLARLRGDDDSARQLIRLLDRRSNRNPFLLLALGDLSLEEGRLGEARSFYRRARRLGPMDAETSAALGLWAHAAGRERQARSWLTRAQLLDPESPRVLRLAETLDGAAEPAD